ncbi:MAG: hypothetical protein ACMXYK_00170 [Candidatus Woesearchaeota archaeon]
MVAKKLGLFVAGKLLGGALALYAAKRYEQHRELEYLHNQYTLQEDISNVRTAMDDHFNTFQYTFLDPHKGRQERIFLELRQLEHLVRERPNGGNGLTESKE